MSCQGANLLRLAKLLQLDARPSRRPNYAGVVAQSTTMPLVKATNDTSSHVPGRFDAVEREMAAELQLTKANTSRAAPPH